MAPKCGAQLAVSNHACPILLSISEVSMSLPMVILCSWMHVTGYFLHTQNAVFYIWLFYPSLSSDQFPKTSSIVFNVWFILSDTSTKHRLFNFCIYDFSHVALKKFVNANVNNFGDIGSPCLTLLSILNLSVLQYNLVQEVTFLWVLFGSCKKTHTRLC